MELVLIFSVKTLIGHPVVCMQTIVLRGPSDLKKKIGRRRK